MEVARELVEQQDERERRIAGAEPMVAAARCRAAMVLAELRGERGIERRVGLEPDLARRIVFRRARRAEPEIEQSPHPPFVIHRATLAAGGRPAQRRGQSQRHSRSGPGSTWTYSR